MMREQGRANSDPSTSTGRLRPEASGSPSSMRMHSSPWIPVSPSAWASAWRASGCTSSWRMIPSSSASSISSAMAGISLRVRR